MKRGCLLGGVLLAAACTQDSPLETGIDLLPPGAIQTFEILLEPDRFIVWDTSFGLYSVPADAGFVIIANAFEGALNSRALVRYTLPPTLVVRDDAGVLRTDSSPTYFAGNIALLIDTLASTPPPVELELFRTTEDWDRTSANWQFRVDTAGGRLPWAQPGGSPGALVGTHLFLGETDTVRIPVDSATLAVWADETNPGRGGLIATSTAGARLRGSLPVLEVQARSSIRPDTVLELTLVPSRTFIFEPDLPDSVAAPRVGGTPEWRTILRLRPGLDTVRVPCPGTNCFALLRDLTVNYAALRLQPIQPPAGYSPEAPLHVVAHILVPSELVPLQRSPITPAIGLAADIPVSSFRTADAPVVELAITDFVRLLAADTVTTTFRPSHLVLAPTGQLRTFGFGQFAQQPRLRLVLTFARELR